MPENHLKSEDIDAPLSFAYSLAVSQHVWVDVEPCSFSTLPTNISKRLPSFSMQGKSSPLQLARLEPLGHRVTGNRQQGAPQGTRDEMDGARHERRRQPPGLRRGARRRARDQLPCRPRFYQNPWL